MQETCSKWENVLTCCHVPPACLPQAGQLELTHKGRAVYDSALPLEPAMRLYDSCSRAEDGACPRLLWHTLCRRVVAAVQSL